MAVLCVLAALVTVDVPQELHPHLAPAQQQAASKQLLVQLAQALNRPCSEQVPLHPPRQSVAVL